MKALGVLIEQTDEQFRLRIYRNRADENPRWEPRHSDLEFEGQAGMALGQYVQVMAHREGESFVADGIEPIHIPHGAIVGDHIRETLGGLVIRSHHRVPTNPPRLKGQNKKVDPTLKKKELSEDTIEAANTTKNAVIAATDAPSVSLEIADSDLASSSSTLNSETEISEPSSLQKKVLPQVSPKAETTEPITTNPLAVDIPTVTLEPEPQVKQKFKFMVQVNGREFPGKVSVELKAGMLLIDGRMVTQTKLAIVVGEPKNVFADGKTQKSGNRTILSSR